MNMNIMTPEKEQEIADFEKLKVLGKTYDIDPMKIAVAQIVLVLRNRFREMSEEEFEAFCNQGIEAILPFAGIRLPEPEIEDPEGGWRSMPGWVKRKPKAPEEPEFS